MSLLEEECVERVFIYKFPTCTTNEEYVLEIPLKIPYQGSIKELTYRIMSSFKLPYYVESDLMETIQRTIKELTLQFYDEKSEKVIDATKKGDLNIEDIIKNWEKTYKQKTVEYADPIGTTDEELFAAAYHRLVHSPSLEPILQAEHKYGRDVTEVIQMRNTDYEQLTQKQTEEMRVAVEALEAGSTEKSINDMAGRHFEEQSLLQGHWGSRVDALKLEQRRQYRNWIMRLLEEQQTNMLPTPVGSPMVPMPPIRPALGTFVPNEEKQTSDYPILEESFTIHLGSQMKQMHNIRILTGDVLDFCRTKKSDTGDPTPQRLQTALGLYSNDLCGLVLLSDNHLGSYSGITKELCSICQLTTEFHFPPIDEQLEKIREDVKEAVAWRQAHHREGSDPQTKKPTSKTLQTGDVFITRHSNLAQVHVVFHMVVNDSLRSGDINSRHPAILGLRNILKTACCNDVTTLTIPVLLVHEMTEVSFQDSTRLYNTRQEQGCHITRPIKSIDSFNYQEMTVAWCTKRAELVFKCVKGFMIEMASWGGAELKNLQFLVPKGMSEEVFGTLATMLPSIFRVSNPLVFKATSTPQTPKK
ncbi:protein C12orf4 isoform X1 [Vespula maculifrons]|uniref:Protein C12orf4 isoform X1 n=1 Tax=Vespula maculifrons TaxID=7453 RepID=A0ABD2CCY7_VESMC